jgi:hypothetical protein
VDSLKVVAVAVAAGCIKVFLEMEVVRSPNARAWDVMKTTPPPGPHHETGRHIHLHTIVASFAVGVASIAVVASCCMLIWGRKP